MGVYSASELSPESRIHYFLKKSHGLAHYSRVATSPQVGPDQQQAAARILEAFNSDLIPDITDLFVANGNDAEAAFRVVSALIPNLDIPAVRENSENLARMQNPTEAPSIS